MNGASSMNNDLPATTPASQGYYFPAEYAQHIATWLTWPHKEASWPGKIDSIYPSYCRFVREIAESELVRINVNDESMKQAAIEKLSKARVNMDRVEFFLNPTNDAWCRDHGPAFLLNRHDPNKKMIVDWNYNAWGNKYPPFDLDDVIPTRIANHFQLPVANPGIVMEGGSVDFNGQGTLITSTACLMNENRNPQLRRDQIEKYLRDFYGVEQVLWVSEGIAGDDTDGHIDDTVRFVNVDTVVAVVEADGSDVNYAPLRRNLAELSKMRLADGRQLHVVELPMPVPVVYEDQRLPASYANFYISNRSVIVPTYACETDDAALSILAKCFPERKIVGIDSTDIIWGLGSFHCLSQQEPALSAQ
jgi:agmatine deiminase